MKKLLSIFVSLLALVAPSVATDATFSWTPNPVAEMVSVYRIEYLKLPAVTNWSTLTIVPSSTNSTVVTGLQPGFTYQFRIFADNSIGKGTNISAVVQIPSVLPTAVVNYQLSAPLK